MEKIAAVLSTFAKRLAELFQARTGIVWLTTREETRAERAIVEAATLANLSPLTWDAVAGWRDIAGRSAFSGREIDPSAALASIARAESRSLYIMRDLPAFAADPFVSRAIRNLSRDLPTRPRASASAIVILTTRPDIPADLQGAVTAIDLPLPDRGEIAALLDGVISTLPDSLRDVAANGSRDAAIDAAVGLTETAATQAFQRCIVSARKVDPEMISADKEREVSKTRLLEWCKADPRGLSAIGGLESFKAWLETRREAFGVAAREYGLPAPKGALLVGPPGTGKSLSAKAISAAWKMPLLRLDLGAVKSKFVGESEANLRAALKVAESIAPCILWLDEIEKALAGATQGAADGGVSADALGAILTWLQERAGAVFMFATANDVSALPPELLRKGRFDEIFSLDLPTTRERAAIVSAAMRQYRREEIIDPSAIAAETTGFVGAEIAALIPAALYRAFADGKRPIETADIIAAARETVPLSKTSPEKIAAVRKWGAERARPASLPEIAETSNVPSIDIA